MVFYCCFAKSTKPLEEFLSVEVRPEIITNLIEKDCAYLAINTIASGATTEAIIRNQQKIGVTRNFEVGGEVKAFRPYRKVKFANNFYPFLNYIPKIPRLLLNFLNAKKI